MSWRRIWGCSGPFRGVFASCLLRACSLLAKPIFELFVDLLRNELCGVSAADLVDDVHDEAEDVAFVAVEFAFVYERPRFSSLFTQASDLFLLAAQRIVFLVSSAGRYCSINLLLLIRDVLQRLFALRFGCEALGGLFLEVLDKLIGIAFDQFNRLIPIRRILIRSLGKLSSPNYERSLRFAPNLVVLEEVSP